MLNFSSTAPRKTMVNAKNKLQKFEKVTLIVISPEALH